MECKIYKLTNEINGKMYIGQTWQSLSQRWHGGKGYDECPYLANAIKKYGKQNFKYEVLVTVNDQPTADWMENFWITTFNSVDKKIGYNLKAGGSYGKHSQATKDKISLKNREYTEKESNIVKDYTSATYSNSELKNKYGISSTHLYRILKRNNIVLSNIQDRLKSILARETAKPNLTRYKKRI